MSSFVSASCRVLHDYTGRTTKLMVPSGALFLSGTESMYPFWSKSQSQFWSGHIQICHIYVAKTIYRSHLAVLRWPWLPALSICTVVVRRGLGRRSVKSEKTSPARIWTPSAEYRCPIGTSTAKSRSCTLNRNYSSAWEVWAHWASSRLGKEKPHPKQRTGHVHFYALLRRPFNESIPGAETLSVCHSS